MKAKDDAMLISMGLTKIGKEWGIDSNTSDLVTKSDYYLHTFIAKHDWKRFEAQVLTTNCSGTLETPVNMWVATDDNGTWFSGGRYLFSLSIGQKLIIEGDEKNYMSRFFFDYNKLAELDALGITEYTVPNEAECRDMVARMCLSAM